MKAVDILKMIKGHECNAALILETERKAITDIRDDVSALPESGARRLMLSLLDDRFDALAACVPDIEIHL